MGCASSNTSLEAAKKAVNGAMEAGDRVIEDVGEGIETTKTAVNNAAHDVMTRVAGTVDRLGRLPEEMDEVKDKVMEHIPLKSDELMNKRNEMMSKALSVTDDVEKMTDELIKDTEDAMEDMQDEVMTIVQEVSDDVVAKKEGAMEMMDATRDEMMEKVDEMKESVDVVRENLMAKFEPQKPPEDDLLDIVDLADESTTEADALEDTMPMPEKDESTTMD